MIISIPLEQPINQHTTGHIPKVKQTNTVKLVIGQPVEANKAGPNMIKPNMKRARSTGNLCEEKSNMDISPSKMIRVVDEIRIPTTPPTMCQDNIETSAIGTSPDAEILDVPDDSSDDGQFDYTEPDEHQRSRYTLATSTNMVKVNNFDLLLPNKDNVAPDKLVAKPKPTEGEKKKEPNILQEILFALSLENGISQEEMKRLQEIPMMKFLDAQVDVISKQMSEVLKDIRQKPAKNQ